MADVNIGSDALLVTTLNDNDRVTITKEAMDQQVATIALKEFRKSIPYVGENIIPCSPVFYELGSYNTADGSGSPVEGGPYMRTKDYWPATSGQYIASISDNFVHCGLVAYNTDKVVVATVVIKTTEWVNQTFELPANTTYVRFAGRMDPYNESSQPGDILNTRIKIERGSIATPWCPNAEDVVLKPDYTNLSEQIVPGEFWLDENGAARQVYCRTFSLQTPSDYNSGSTMVISLVPLGIKACHLEMFQCFSSLNVGGYQGVWLQNGLWQSNPTNGLQLIMEDVTGFDRRNSKCVVSVKYTKA